MNTLDTADFIELVIKHLIRDRATFLKARDLKVTVDDFGDGNVFDVDFLLPDQVQKEV